MPKQTQPKPIPPDLTPDVPDLSTPEALAERVIDLCGEQSEPEKDPSVKSLFKVRPGRFTDAALLLCDWIESRKQPRAPRSRKAGDDDAWLEWDSALQRFQNMWPALRAIFRLKPPFDAAQADRLFAWVSRAKEFETWSLPLGAFVAVAEQHPSPLSDTAAKALRRMRESLAHGQPDRNERRVIDKIDELLGQAPDLPLKPGDPIADAAIADLTATDPAKRAAWTALLRHCPTATGTTPPKTWLKGATPLLEPLARELAHYLARWFPLLASSRSGGKPSRVDVKNMEILKGLVWCADLVIQRELVAGTKDARPVPDHLAALAAALQQLAIASYTKVPAQGRRCPKVGDAAIVALCHFPVDIAAARITAVQRACRNPMTDETLNTALLALAQTSGIPRDQLEELTIPSFGLSEDGTRRILLGPVTAVLDISSGSPEVTYLNDKGKPVKSLPAAVKRDHADAVANLKQDVKDLTKLLASQRDRLDALLGTPRTWPLNDFRRLYLDHPLVSRVARRLIWLVDSCPALFRDGRFEDVTGTPLTTADTSTVTPWHPIHADAATVLDWRQRLESLQITQPFKQAHREVYLLTDAERATRTYSNRFAAHLIRQAQFRALATARGWSVGYIGPWDSGGATPTRELPTCGLRVEFWVDHADVNDAGADSLPGGGSVYLSTDQVRFCRTGTDTPLPLDQVPPLALSEAMRDVDLFVGVCSVGNDPTWRDHTTDPHYRGYWESYSFGDLNASARTRKDVLSRLLPRLTIASRCQLTDKFLTVRGDLRTYKIHLGSGNILMDPNDQYLCIVPDRRPTSDGDVFLPFEGDHLLAVILSKAFLLANDTAITDPTITRQIKRD